MRRAQLKANSKAGASILWIFCLKKSEKKIIKSLGVTKIELYILMI